MTPEQRKYYDAKILVARLTEDDFQDWYYRNYQVSSSVHQDGMFSSVKEKLEYENKSYEEYCEIHGKPYDEE